MSDEQAVVGDDWAAALAEQSTAASARPAAFEPLAVTPVHTPNSHDIEMIMDIPVLLTVELGRTRLPIRHILQLAQGSIIELDGLAGEPMNVLVNGCLIAQGEVVVVNEKFGIRLTDIVAPAERMRKLNR
jgi:flagellar motor switch protein FliN/FliY